MAEYQFWLLLFTIFFTNAFNKDITSNFMGNAVTFLGLGFCLTQMIMSIL